MQELQELERELRSQQLTTLTRIAEMKAMHSRLVLIRNREARTVLETLMPNLKIKTVRRLLEQVPGFRVQMTTGWFGQEKVDPNESVELVRVRLGIYLDNHPGQKPEVWMKTVGVTDAAFADNLKVIARATSELTEIEKRISAVEKLLAGGLAKLPPEKRLQIKQAAKAANRSPRVLAEPLPQSPVPNPRDYDTVVNSPDLFPMWLWYTILTDNVPESHQHVHSPAPVYGDHGQSSESELRHNSDDVPSDTVDHGRQGGHNHSDPAPSHHHVHHDPITLDHHTDLGSQSFS